MNSTINNNNIQEQSKILDKFTPKKKRSVILSEVYKLAYEHTGDENYSRKADRVAECGDNLTFAHEITSQGIKEVGKLIKAFFCKDRFCPMCQWRKSLKLFAQLSMCLAMIRDQYKLIFLTLTVPNVTDDQLADTISEMLKGYDRFMKRRPIKAIVKGYFRTLEITYNKKEKTWHPHIHVLLAVPKNYGVAGHEYIKQETWLKYWKESMRNPAIQIVWIESVKNKDKTESYDQLSEEDLSKAINEISKYSVKGSQLLNTKDLSISEHLVLVAENALKHRKLFHFGGVLMETFKQAQLVSVESEQADLTDQTELDPTLAYAIIKYQWKQGVYVMDPQIMSLEEWQKEKKIRTFAHFTKTTAKIEKRIRKRGDKKYVPCP